MSGHGHVTPNADGMKARCGGPAICPKCAVEAAQQGTCDCGTGPAGTPVCSSCIARMAQTTTLAVPLYVGDVPDCTCGPWWGICPPPPCPVHTVTVPHVVIMTPPVRVTTTDGVEWPPLVPVPQGWECPRCKTISAPHAMTCQGAGCKP